MKLSFGGTALHRLFVGRNTFISDCYEEYINRNRQSKKTKSRLHEWLFLIRLNFEHFIIPEEGVSKKNFYKGDISYMKKKLFNRIINKSASIYEVAYVLYRGGVGYVVDDKGFLSVA